jgi:hypothetical protein
MFDEIQELDEGDLHEEKRELEEIIPRMRASLDRGADWLISQFAPGGPIMERRDLSYCHKAIWGLYEVGRLEAVNTLLDWVHENARIGVARYGFPEEPPFNNEMQLLYRFLTLGRVAEKVGHPVFTDKETREEVLTYQDTAGGVFGNKDDPKYLAVQNPLLASFFVEWATAAGLLDVAKASADFLAMLVGQNLPHMVDEPSRFYFNYDPIKRDLITEPSPDGKINCFVDTLGEKQQFYQIGTAMAALANYYLEGGSPRHLEGALFLADFEEGLNREGLRWPSYCKIGWGGAALYRATGSPEHRKMAARVSEVTFMGSQTAGGGWEDMYYPLVDHGAWESVTYDGSGSVPEIPCDGTWERLSGYEITGEFIAEMGFTLRAFEEALDVINERLG